MRSPSEEATTVPAAKLDLLREDRALYAPGRVPEIIEVPEFLFLMVDRHGDPNVSPGYREAVEALYSVSYTLKFAIRRGLRQLDYRMLPLEGLWWVADMSRLSTGHKDDRDWTAMIRQPEEIDRALLEDAVRTATARRQLPAAERLRLERFAEGAWPPRCCTSARTRRRARPSNGCTASSPSEAMRRPASTTRST
jgi:hypothetical protein